MGDKRKPRTSIWHKPLFLVCLALSLGVPVFYFDWVVVDIFLVSKDDHQVRKDDFGLRTLSS
jgi:hypothetical protein